jgi:hypothetical protein
MKDKNMNETTERVRTSFAPDVCFDVPTAPTVPFRASLISELESLKYRLLRLGLQSARNPGQHVLLRRAANEAAALVWLTPFPLLLFPALFEEKARAATRRDGRAARAQRHGKNLLLKAA